MLEYLDLAKAMLPEEYKAQRKELQKQLFLVHRRAYELNLRTVILFEGWDTAGKGSAVQTLTDKLDPRGCRVYHTMGPERYEAVRPWMWRFWNHLPPSGQMMIFDRSWYGRVLVERVDGCLNPDLVKQSFQDIVDFERLLAEEGYILIKFWLHISQEEMERRLCKLAEDPDESWQIEPEDWEHLRRYHEYNGAAEEMLAATEIDYAPWVLVEATDPFWRSYKILSHVLVRLQEAVAQAEAKVAAKEAARVAAQAAAEAQVAAEEAAAAKAAAKAGKPEEDKGKDKGNSKKKKG